MYICLHTSKIEVQYKIRIQCTYNKIYIYIKIKLFISIYPIYFHNDIIPSILLF